MGTGTIRGGLTSAEARRRLASFGPNALPAPKRTSAARRLLRQVQSPLVYLLMGALVVEIGLWLGEGGRGVPVEALAIFAIVALNAWLGFRQERKADAALDRLREMAAPRAWVVRDGAIVRVPGRELVPGDRVRVAEGERVPADGTLVHGQGVLVDESILTGESVPVDKLPGEPVFSGTLQVRGYALVAVTATGPASAMGRLATSLAALEDESTPLEKRLRAFGARIARWMLALAAALVALGLVVEGADDLGHLLLFAVALAVAAVPEGLPAVLTSTLALGTERMARRKAVVRRLAAVEALGAVTVVATDKTGTLTESRMDVRRLDATDREAALRALVIANDADPASGAGDPIDAGLLRFAAADGVDVAALRQRSPRTSARPFDAAWKFVRVTVEDGGARVSWLKGAPEVLLRRCRLDEAARARWLARTEAAAGEGLRVLALARGDGEAEDGLDLLGLVMVWDPPRPEVAEAIRRVRQAGVRVLLVTGDHPATALAVAAQVGLPARSALTGEALAALEGEALRSAVRSTDVFARVAPEHKLAIVEALKADGHVVAMTGDGVNDAPALKRADVGVAMGVRGSDVAREVADLVLLDDDFATLVVAIEEGRSIYQNIQKFVRLLFADNLAELVLILGGMAVAVALGLRRPDGALLLPLTAVQILWVNLVTDSLPALAMAVERNPEVMARPPRPPEAPILEGRTLRFVVSAGGLIGATDLALLLLLPHTGRDPDVTRTMVFCYLPLVSATLALAARRLDDVPPRNRALLGAVTLMVALQGVAFVVPGLRRALGLVALAPADFVIVVAATVATGAAVRALADGMRRAAPRPSPPRP
jgi:Ca2+-transporting ATPase